MYEIFEKLRIQKGLSISKVAKDIGISPSTLTDWRAGRYIPKTDKLVQLALYFDVPLEYLRTGIMPDNYVSNKESELLEMFRKLNGSAQEKAIEYLYMLTRLPENQKVPELSNSNVG